MMIIPVGVVMWIDLHIINLNGKFRDTTLEYVVTA